MFASAMVGWLAESTGFAGCALIALMASTPCPLQFSENKAISVTFFLLSSMDLLWICGKVSEQNRLECIPIMAFQFNLIAGSRSPSCS
jgi:hypothetical protein